MRPTVPYSRKLATGNARFSRVSASVALFGTFLGVYLVISSQSFPSGVGTLPGPGFFPLLLGIFCVLFSAMIAREAPRSPASASSPSPADSSWKLPALAALLVLLWLLSWKTIPFVLRTPLLVLSLMRVSGSRWRSAALAAILFTAVSYAIFQLVLRVDLG